MVVLAVFLIIIQIIFIGVIIYYRNERNNLSLKINAFFNNQMIMKKEIAKDLHNGLSGDLNAIRNYLIVLNQKEIMTVDKEILSEIKIGIDQAIQFNRNLSHKLVPPNLEQDGLLITLKKYLENKKLDSTIQYEFYCKEEDLFIEEYYTTYELYSIIIELIANADRNKSTSCKLKIHRQNSNLTFEIVDDGIHFMNDDLNKNSTIINWQYICSRIKSINATINKVETANGNHIIIQLKRNYD